MRWDWHRGGWKNWPAIAGRRALPSRVWVLQTLSWLDSDGKIQGMVEHLLKDLTVITQEARQGQILQEGVAIVLCGKPNAGKSTLLRIMSGQDTAIDGEARPQPGISIGYLSQEPGLDPAKDVRGNVEDAYFVLPRL